MAGIFSWQNWKNLVVGKGSGKGKGGDKGGNSHLYPESADPNLPVCALSNRVKVLCKDFEERKEKQGAEKETSKQEELFKRLTRERGLDPDAMVAKGAVRTGKGPVVITPPKKKLKKGPGGQIVIASGALDSIGLGDDDDDSGSDGGASTTSGITTVAKKDAFMRCGDIETIAKKIGVTISLGKEDDPISLTNAAAKIVAARGFSRNDWQKERQKVYGLGASSAGSRLKDDAMVCSLLIGHLGRHANRM